MVAVDLEFCGNNFQQFCFHLVYIFTWCKPRTVGYPKNMGIYGDSRPAKCGIQYHVGGFTSDARQCFQRFAVFRDLSLMFFCQYLTGFNHIGCFGIKQADGLNGFTDTFNPQFQHFLRGRGRSK